MRADFTIAGIYHRRIRMPVIGFLDRVLDREIFTAALMCQVDGKRSPLGFGSVKLRPGGRAELIQSSLRGFVIERLLVATRAPFVATLRAGNDLVELPPNDGLPSYPIGPFPAGIELRLELYRPRAPAAESV